jgi:hypothetical protein
LVIKKAIIKKLSIYYKSAILVVLLKNLYILGGKNMIYKLIELIFKVFGLFGSDCETRDKNNDSIILISSSGDSYTKKPENRFSVKRFYKENGIF